MKANWIGLGVVAVAAITMIAYKTHVSPGTSAVDASRIPRVLLVADLSEADAEGDGCADIIRSVRATAARGITVQELNADTKSDLLGRYRVLTVPTVLILDPKGEVVSRFEGEGRQTVSAVRTALEELQ